MRMADLPEQVVMMADAAAGGARQLEEGEKARVRDFVQGCWPRFRGGSLSAHFERS